MAQAPAFIIIGLVFQDQFGKSISKIVFLICVHPLFNIFSERNFSFSSGEGSLQVSFLPNHL
ncbi:hypothetical protein SAMN05444412_1243 [Rhodonellum ikkaensis]|uniref:Uncharacterized protein n=1 Tax=Rhodonellum ikkaensis TaxID=336829 RepID=A0A1H3U045_9BACT|nr:hypothetical protein SAMN05444412_1243 [Rhodonellum ikkaensis]